MVLDVASVCTDVGVIPLILKQMQQTSVLTWLLNHYLWFSAAQKVFLFVIFDRIVLVGEIVQIG